jgi:hypothetical protein
MKQPFDDFLTGSAETMGNYLLSEALLMGIVIILTDDTGEEYYEINTEWSKD